MPAARLFRGRRSHSRRPRRRARPRPSQSVAETRGSVIELVRWRRVRKTGADWRGRVPGAGGVGVRRWRGKVAPGAARATPAVELRSGRRFVVDEPDVAEAN